MNADKKIGKDHAIWREFSFALALQSKIEAVKNSESEPVFVQSKFKLLSLLVKGRRTQRKLNCS